MKKIVCGWLLIVGLAVILGNVVHWTVGLAAVVVPIAVVFLRIKSNTAYRSRCENNLDKVLSQ